MKIEIDLNMIELGDDAYYETAAKALLSEIETAVKEAVRAQLKADKSKIEKAAKEAYKDAIDSLDVSKIVQSVIKRSSK